MKKNVKVTEMNVTTTCNTTKRINKIGKDIAYMTGINICSTMLTMGALSLVSGIARKVKVNKANKELQAMANSESMYEDEDK